MFSGGYSMGNEAPVYPPFQAGPRSGLLQLCAAVAQYFADYGVPATVADVGLKYRNFTLNQSAPGGADRVVFIPGKYSGGEPASREYGELNRETRNHASVGNPREILNWERPFTLSVWAAPVAGRPRDEGSLIGIAENLLEEIARAVNAAGHSDVTWGSVMINTPSADIGFGVELLVSATQRGPLYDQTLDYVTGEVKLTRQT